MAAPIEMEALNPHTYIRVHEKDGPRAFEDIYGQYLAADDPRRVLAVGFISYLLKNGVSVDMLAGEAAETVSSGLDRLSEASNGLVIYKGKGFRYFREPPTTIDNMVDQSVTNAEFWISKFGPEMFERHMHHGRFRRRFYSAPLDGGFKLDVKGGSGSGTFSIDFSIGIDRGPKKSGELWRLGMDTGIEPKSGHRVARIIRSGSAMKSANVDWEEKTAAYEAFKKRYGIAPNRALAFLAMFVAHDMPETTGIKAITYQGVKDRAMTHTYGKTMVKFDYVRFFEDCGFWQSVDPNWLQIPDGPENFYASLATDQTDQRGLRAHEISGLEAVMEAFTHSRVIEAGHVIGDLIMPLTVCGNDSPEELEASINGHRQIHGKQINSV